MGKVETQEWSSFSGDSSLNTGVVGNEGTSMLYLTLYVQLKCVFSGQASKTPEQGYTPTGIVLGEIHVANVQERMVPEAGGYKQL